jgi:hypothetical protein
MVNPFFEAFLDGFTGAGLFTELRRPGAATQVFADEDEEQTQSVSEAEPSPPHPCETDYPTSSQRESPSFLSQQTGLDHGCALTRS